MTVTRRYKYRIYPTHEQEQILKQNLGSVRFVYNYCIEYADTRHTNGEEYPGYYGPDGFAAQITKLKQDPEYAWLKSADNTALQNVAKQTNNAFQNMFAKRAGHPKYKTKREHRQSYTSTNNKTKSGGTIRFTDKKHILLPKIGEIRIRGTVRHYEKLTYATVTHSPSGKWTVSVCVDVDLDKCYDEKQKRKRSHGDKTTGIDLGIKSYATTFDGVIYEHIENPKFYGRALEKLGKEQRKLSRMRNHETKAMKECGIHSRNYEKQRLKVAKLYETITNMRMDVLHKLSRQLACENQTLIVETLEIKRMLESVDISGLNRLIADAS